MAKLVSQFKPWVRTSIEASKVRVEARMTSAMGKFMCELHGRIDSFKHRMGSRLREAHISDLTGLTKEVDAFREEVQDLAIIHIPIIPPIPTSVPTALDFEVDLFADEEPPIAKGKRPQIPKGRTDSEDEFEIDLWRVTKSSRVEYHASQIAHEQRALGSSSSQPPLSPDAPSMEPREHTNDTTMDGPTSDA